jgi:hypothetical protein
MSNLVFVCTKSFCREIIQVPHGMLEGQSLPCACGKITLELSSRDGAKGKRVPCMVVQQQGCKSCGGRGHMDGNRCEFCSSVGVDA